jgi:hypothetical protein
MKNGRGGTTPLIAIQHFSSEKKHVRGVYIAIRVKTHKAVSKKPASYEVPAIHRETICECDVVPYAPSVPSLTQVRG